jgi:tripartite-type tricarboxylate transporter receptor subunit TctC
MIHRRAFLAGCAALPLARDALAQPGPLTKIVFPFAAGGSGDLTCRVLAEHLAPLLGRHIIVENRTPATA